MNVKIKTVYGELSFSMAKDDALALIDRATRYAEEYAEADGTALKAERNDAAPAYAYAMKAVSDQKKYATGGIIKENYINNPPAATENDPDTPTPPERVVPASRLEKLFGAKGDWKMPAAASAPSDDTASGEEEPRGWGYRGFLYIQCEECKKVKGYYIKTNITAHKCECGHSTELRNLLPLKMRCKCETKLNYMTNIQNNLVELDCFHCGSPVTLELNYKAKAYLTIGEHGRKS